MDGFAAYALAFYAEAALAKDLGAPLSKRAPPGALADSVIDNPDTPARRVKMHGN